MEDSKKLFKIILIVVIVLAVYIGGCYSSANDIVKQTTWKIPKEDIEYYSPAGLGVYREQDGQIGILTDDGVVTASAENGLSEAPFAVDDWSYVFYFPGIEYETSMRLRLRRL